ncbi:uncharacterized protein N7473_013229 [Penicillium subrubescens]|uniref:uncharacterized protein n=1 Tax=Penicillium subrubescens TaxID=1316194 RepID=UPI00254552A8|nr:uncharacterized protein N7473_013229 [Penicillium subrubescens]KAJ5873670.1 hypothetical protein N7473_013229 [Penicillium subrubescens]
MDPKSKLCSSDHEQQPYPRPVHANFKTLSTDQVTSADRVRSMNRKLRPLQPPEPRKSLLLPPSVSVSYQLQSAAIKPTDSSRVNWNRHFTVKGEIQVPRGPYLLDTLVMDGIARRLEGPVVLSSVLEVSATNSVYVNTGCENGTEQTEHTLQIPLENGSFHYDHVSFNRPQSETDSRVGPVDFFICFRVLCFLFNDCKVRCEIGREGPFRLESNGGCPSSTTADGLTSQDQENARILPTHPGVSQHVDSRLLTAFSPNNLATNVVVQKGEPHRDLSQHASGLIDPAQLLLRMPTRDVVKVSEANGDEENFQHSSQLLRPRPGAPVRRKATVLQRSEPPRETHAYPRLNLGMLPLAT